MIVVGVGPQTPQDVLQLAEQISAGAAMTLCGVVLDTWDGPSLATGIDSSYRQALVDRVQHQLNDAQAELAHPEKASTIVRQGPSIPEELLAEADDRHAQTLVVGSSRRAALGRISLGSVSGQLVHSASLPVVLTPRHYAAGSREPISRLVVGLQPSDGPFAADEVSEFARMMGADVELVTFGVRPWPQGMHVDEAEWEGMFTSWRDQVKDMQKMVAAELEASGVTVLARQHLDAYRWSSAIDDFQWRPGDMMALFSSRRGQVSRVFLGSTAARILRHVPVPTVVLPRFER